MTEKILAIRNPDKTCCKCLKQSEHVHHIEIGKMGYGSGFDMWSTQINLCEDCYSQTNQEWWKLNQKIAFSHEDYNFYEYEYEDEIFNFVKSLPIQGQELFWNRYSTDNYNMEPQDWIDYELHILPHEKCKEYSMYSWQEIEAYNERFPRCNWPVQRVWNDNSRGCKCPFGASGYEGQTANENISDECYNCSYYIERYESIKIMSSDDYEKYESYIKGKIAIEKYSNMFK